MEEAGTAVEARPRFSLRTLDDGNSTQLHLEVELPGRSGRGGAAQLAAAAAAACPPNACLPLPASAARLPTAAGVTDSSQIRFSIEGDRQLRVHVPGRYRAVNAGCASLPHSPAASVLHVLLLCTPAMH